MTETDVKSIYDYMSAKSYGVNDKLRKGEKLSSEEQSLVNNLDKALEKMPTYEGNLQRSLFFYSDEDVENFVKQFEIGKSITFKEYISTTKGEVYNPDGQVQIYFQDTKHGRDISSLNEAEQEILYERNSSFITDNIVLNDGKYFILVAEKDE